MMFPYLDYIHPELLVLIPVSMFLGLGFKKGGRVCPVDIPLIIGFFNVIMALLWVLGGADKGGINWFAAVFTAVVQGVLCAGAAVYSHQVYKQGKQARRYKNGD